MADNAGKIIDAAAARDRLIEAAAAAGRLASPSFRPGERTSARVVFKQGGSPVSDADLAVDAFLKQTLAAAFPGAGWLSEETEDNSDRLSRSIVLVVDPIDGTRAFITGDPRWAVSIALVVAGRPVAGVVHAPALGQTYAAAAGLGATLNGAPIGVAARTSLDGARVAGPRPMIEAIGRAYGVAFAIEPKVPSLAYRIALVASGAIDLALASDKAHDWDIAAADLILEEAGGALVDAQGAARKYNRAETLHPVLLAAPRRLVAPLVAAFARTGGGQGASDAPVSG